MVYMSWESLNSVKQKTYYTIILEEKQRTLDPSLTRQLSCKYFLYHAGIVPRRYQMYAEIHFIGELHETEGKFWKKIGHSVPIVVPARKILL